MPPRPALQPLALGIGHPELSASASNRRPALLPLGAMMAAVALSGAAQAQQSAEPAARAAQSEAAALPAINVNAQREENVGYQGVRTTVGKSPQLLRDVPQSVTVVTEQLIQDRGADTLKEALRNVAGLTFNAGEGGRIGDNITLRGYSLVGDLYLDGIRDIAQYNREVFNVEQVDVLRGSASMLFGRGSTGGVVNQVSKRPFLSNLNEAALTLGSDAYKRGTADLNRVVGENAAVRLNVMKTDTDSFRNGVQSERCPITSSRATTRPISACPTSAASR
jgi:catecholate siderophore receptor